MKRLLLCSVLAIVALTLTVSLPTSGLAAGKKTHAPVSWTVGSPTGTWFGVAAAVADLVHKKYDGQPISLLPGAGSIGNVSRVGAGQMDLGFSFGPFLRMAQAGGNELYPKAFPQLRSIGTMTSNLLHLIVSKENAAMGLEKVLARKTPLKIATGPKGSSEQFLLIQVLKVYGVTFADIQKWGGRIDKLGSSPRADAWKNRQADMAEFSITPPASAVTELMSGRPAALISLADKVRDSMVKDWGVIKMVIPAKSYPGQDRDVQTTGMPYLIFATTNLDAEFAYDIAKSVAEGRDRMIQGHSSFNKWQPQDMVKGLGIELHEGAARYYRERGWIK